MDLLAGKVAIVTGGARGIGRAHCIELARHGATVVVNDISDERDDVVREIAAAGGSATSDATSVRDFDGIGAMVVRVVEAHGRLDAVVNNAALLRNAMLTKTTAAEWQTVLEVNLMGTLALVHHAAGYWRAQSKDGHAPSGRVVNTVSGAGLFGSIGQASYSASKAAIANLTATAALELAPYGVTVNAISPTARTAMTVGLPGLTDRPPDGAWDPFDPANASPVVAWLVSDRSHWLTGALVRIRGNTMLRIRPWALDIDTAYTAQGATRFTVDELDHAMHQLFDGVPPGPPDGW